MLEYLSLTQDFILAEKKNSVINKGFTRKELFVKIVFL